MTVSRGHAYLYTVFRPHTDSCDTSGWLCWMSKSYQLPSHLFWASKSAPSAMCVCLHAAAGAAGLAPVPVLAHSVPPAGVWGAASETCFWQWGEVEFCLVLWAVLVVAACWLCGRRQAGMRQAVCGGKMGAGAQATAAGLGMSACLASKKQTRNKWRHFAKFQPPGMLAQPQPRGPAAPAHAAVAGRCVC